MTKPRQNSSIWSCVRRRRNGKCRRANGARRKPSSPSCSKTGSSLHDGQPAPHTRFLIVPFRPQPATPAPDRPEVVRPRQHRRQGDPQNRPQLVLPTLPPTPIRHLPERIPQQPRHGQPPPQRPPPQSIKPNPSSPHACGLLNQPARTRLALEVGPPHRGNDSPSWAGELCLALAGSREAAAGLSAERGAVRAFPSLRPSRLPS